MDGNSDGWLKMDGRKKDTVEEKGYIGEGSRRGRRREVEWRRECYEWMG